MQPLNGLFVLDFTTLLPGPLATLMLAEAGAEVIKIEQPGGENARRFPPMVDGESAAFLMLNRGKTSMALDFENGRPMEIEAILGNTVRAGRKAGVAIPALESIYAIARMIEAARSSAQG